MKTLTLISRTRTRTLTPTRTPTRFSLFLLFHSSAAAAAAGGEEPYRRRTEPPFPPPPAHRRNFDEENRSVKVTVWWDFENCSVPTSVPAERVAGRIASALRSTGIKGPVTVTAFGDVALMSRAVQEALTSTGVCLNHVPHRGKNSSDRSFMADLVYWVTQNPPPAHLFLISSDKDFANILHRLRMSNYNILLSSNDTASPVLCSAATIMWPWVALVKGENVAAKHFNHPPDGIYGSWYGYHKGILDDPYINSDQYSVPKTEESVESVSETKVHPVPKAVVNAHPVPKVVVNAIRNVLHSYPEGINMSELRAELKKKNVPMDKDFYGYKKFSNLLSALPTVVKFIPNSVGQAMVTEKRSVGSAEHISKSADKVPTSTRGEKSLTRDDKPSAIAPLITKVDYSTTHEVTNTDTSADLSTSQHVRDAAVDVGLLGRKETSGEPPIAGRDSQVKEGLFERIWTTFGGREDDPLAKIDSISLVDSTAREDSVRGDNPKGLKAERKATDSESGSTDSASSSTSVFCVKNSNLDEKKSQQCDKHYDTLKTRTGFFSQLTNWWQNWKYGAKDQDDSSQDVNQEADVNGKCDKISSPTTCHPENHELFSQSHFWDALESFFLDSKGSDLISKSTTRDQLLRGLQKEGPCTIRDLEESHLLRLADLLISDKRWIKEDASHSFPFKLALPNKRRCMNDLSSLFRSNSSETNPPQNLAELKAWFQSIGNGKRITQPEDFQKLFESRFNKKLTSTSYGYPSLLTLFFACSVSNNTENGRKKKKPPSREEILIDCHRLVTDLLKENPEGVNFSNFRRKFFQRYSYVLQCQMLGYPKLASLLQIMPGVKVESSFIMPAERFNSEAFADSTMDVEGKITSLNGEEWEELGPVERFNSEAFADSTMDVEGKITSLNGEEWEELGPVSDTDTIAGTFSKVSLSEEEFSDSEDDMQKDDMQNCVDGLNERLKVREPDSPLLQLLDSWYGSKDRGGKKEQQDEAADGLIDCSVHNPQKPKLEKSYNFVADSGHDENDLAIDRILESLKKRDDSRMQSS